jgi:hypothetical protein
MLIADFVKYVLPDVQGCPTGTAKLAVIDAATEFLTFSGAWSEVQDAIALSDNNAEYDLEAPSGARCIDLRAVYASFSSDGKLIPVSMDQLAVAIPSWQTAESNLPSHYTRAFDYTTIRVFPLPTDVDGHSIRPHASYTLKETATSIPDVIVQRYREVISSGAKARLMVMSKVNWRDIESAKFHLDRFENGKLAAKVIAEHGNTKSSVFVPPRAFGQ